MKPLIVGITLVASLIPATAPAGDLWGCECLLCLSNPDGPMAVVECVDPIARLYKHLSKGKPFPTCDMASSPETGSSYARPGFSYYDQCPAGTTELGAGQFAALGIQNGKELTVGQIVGGIGNGDTMSSGTGGLSAMATPRSKTCVGNVIASTFRSEGLVVMPITVYDAIVVLPPNASPNFIDVYVSDKFYHRVRWQQQLSPAHQQVKTQGGYP